MFRVPNGWDIPYSFVRFPHELLNHRNFRTLSPRATKLLIDIASQYNGRNNGDLCAPLSKMRNRGWNSSDQLFKAKKELVEKLRKKANVWAINRNIWLII